ncbi:Mitochodrial transcription termination factor-related [Spatholobus suberectus]|nr:Mitochodrial transcription termination factor-related [Spatholobus suberectus]
MFRFQPFKPLLLYLKSHTRTPLQTPKPNPLPSALSLKHISLASEQHSFTVSYLVNNCGFSPETALKASERVRFETPQKPDSVIAFFRDNGFTDAQINSIVRRVPDVLTCNPHKRLLPKFQFLLSKGASNSDIVHLVDRCPRLIGSSLENNVIPTFELVRRFLQSDKKTIDCVLASRHFLDYNVAAQNVNMLLGVGVKDSNIAYLFRTRPSILLSSDLMRTVYEVKEMGFDPSKISFVMAMHAKRGISKSRWDAKVDAFKSWGWSEDMVLDTFRKHPLFMLMSRDKINEVMRFWVNRLGWDPLAIARSPKMFAYSLEKRIIPRGLVVRYLIAKGLREKSASLFTPFSVSEKLFLENYVMRFKEEMCQLLKLYQEKMSFQENREDGVAAGG